MLFVIFVCEQMNKNKCHHRSGQTRDDKKKFEMIKDKLNIVNSNCILFSRSLSVLLFFLFFMLWLQKAAPRISSNYKTEKTILRRAKSFGEFTFLPFYSGLFSF